MELYEIFRHHAKKKINKKIKLKNGAKMEEKKREKRNYYDL